MGTACCVLGDCWLASAPPTRSRKPSTSAHARSAATSTAHCRTRPCFLPVTSDSFHPQTEQGQSRTTNQPEGKVAQRALRAVPDRAAFSFTTPVFDPPSYIDNYFLSGPFQKPTRVVATKKNLLRWNNTNPNPGARHVFHGEEILLKMRRSSILPSSGS